MTAVEDVTVGTVHRHPAKVLAPFFTQEAYILLYILPDFYAVCHLVKCAIRGKSIGYVITADGAHPGLGIEDIFHIPRS